MSQSPLHHLSISEAGHPYFSNLNAEAMPFMPFSPYQHSVSQRSNLRPSAPAFVAPVAAIVTSQSSDEHVTKTFDAPPFEASWDSDAGFAGGTPGAIGCDMTPFDFDTGDLVDFNHFSQTTNQSKDLQCVNGGLGVQQTQITDDAVLSSTMQHQQITHDAALNFPMDHIDPTQRAGDAYVIGEQYVLPSIEIDFDLGLATTASALDDSDTYHTTPSLSFGGSSSGDDEDAVTERGEDVDGEYETDDDYQLPNAGSRTSNGTSMPNYPTSDSGRDMFQQTSASAVGAMNSGSSNTSRNKKAGRTGVIDNLKTVRNTSDISGSGVTKSRKKGRANKKVYEKTQETSSSCSNTSLTERLRKANAVIAKQKTKTSLAQRLGQHMRVVVQAGGRVNIEGVYWKAPENDSTIPSTEAAKFSCVTGLIAAIRNNQDCKEVSTTRAFLNRWGNGATHFSPEEIQHAAWEIVVSPPSTQIHQALHSLTQLQDTMIEIHTHGWTKKILEPTLRDQIQKTMFCTFAERFHALVELLKVRVYSTSPVFCRLPVLQHSKRSCTDLLKYERFHTIIGNPFELDTRTSSNRASNIYKGAELKKATGKRNRAQMEDSEDGSQARADTRPMKAAKKSART
jgi:hypothetical protein